jgi:hypothetical protein
MSPARSKPQQPARRKLTSSAKAPTKKATASASLKNSRPDTTNRKRTCTSQHEPATLLGMASADSDHDQELLRVHSLLAQIWHRNKNQHRGQKWWKWVSILKRSVRDLVDRTGAVEESGVGLKNGEKHLNEAALARKRMERDRARREQREQVEEWLREVVLAKCWL